MLCHKFAFDLLYKGLKLFNVLIGVVVVFGQSSLLLWCKRLNLASKYAYHLR